MQSEMFDATLADHRRPRPENSDGRSCVQTVDAAAGSTPGPCPGGQPYSRKLDASVIDLLISEPDSLVAD
jgi:hypothetical protein